jgi:hypothetical protein
LVSFPSPDARASPSSRYSSRCSAKICNERLERHVLRYCTQIDNTHTRMKKGKEKKGYDRIDGIQNLRIR